MFDYIVITAANEAQARGYRAQTKNRPEVKVISDRVNLLTIFVHGDLTVEVVGVLITLVDTPM